ncbi:MAG: recA, partial [Thermoleophilia bacterium]|nr:recA [Thermoleophilia bacterium]
PFKQAEFEITYGEGINQEGSIIDLGVEKKIVTKSGAYISYGDTRLGQGRSAAKTFLKEHPAIAKQILKEIHEAYDVPFIDDGITYDTPAAEATLAAAPTAAAAADSDE